MPSEPLTPAGGYDDLVLRPATESDADAVADLFLAAREAAYPAMPRPVHDAASVRSWVRGCWPRTHPAKAAEAWVAEAPGAAGAAAGPLGYLVLDDDWLDAVYVRPDLTGQGLGTLLLDLAKSLRPDGFGLWVFESNVRARSFYERHGLVTLRTTDGSANEERSPDREMAWLGADPVAALRRRVDDADDRLADLLEQRATLTALIQRHKAVPGHAGRDPEREARIVARMAERAPRLGPDRLGRLMRAVIGELLDAAEEAASPTTAPPGAPDRTAPPSEGDR